MDQRNEIGLIMLMMLLVMLAVLIRAFVQHQNRRYERERNARTIRRPITNRTQPDEGNIFNISSRVQGTTNRDAYLSAEHITISNELNKPPKYDDAPPSYEEAIKLATAHSNSMQTFQAEQANRQNQPQTSTVTSTTTSAVLPAPIHRTE